jgi:precorrin-2 methylase
MVGQQYQTRSSDVGWQLDKTISVTHIITTVSAIAAMVVFGMNLSTKQELTAQAVSEERISRQTMSTAQAAINMKQDQEMNELRTTTRDGIEKLNDKMDKLLLQRAGK